MGPHFPLSGVRKPTGRTKVENIFRIHPRGAHETSAIQENLARPFLANQSLVIIYERACRSRQVYARIVIHGPGDVFITKR